MLSGLSCDQCHPNKALDFNMCILQPSNPVYDWKHGKLKASPGFWQGNNGKINWLGNYVWKLILHCENNL